MKQAITTLRGINQLRTGGQHGGEAQKKRAVRHNVASIRVLEKSGFAVVGEATIVESGDEIEEVILRLDRM